MSQSRIPGSIARTHAIGFTRGAIDGMALSWVDVSTVQIGIGLARDVNDASNIELIATQNVDLTASGINGLDTGSEAGSTWYSVWVVSGSSGVGGLLSAHATAPTLPAGYASAKRRIGWIYNHADDDIQNFNQTGTGRERTIWWNETGADYMKILDAATSNGSWTLVDVSSRVPTTAHTMHLWSYNTAGGATAGRLKPGDYLPADATTVGWSVNAESQSRYQNQEMPCATNKSFRYYTDSAAVDISVIMQGWAETI